jgi:predicted nucleic acid-binding Zn ribbon protein
MRVVSTDEGPIKIGRLVDGFLSQRGLQKHVERAGIAERWADLVGSNIADVTGVRAVADATLFVEVRSSAWISELNMMKAQILERVNAQQSEQARIDKLVFVLAEGPRGTSAPSR